MVWILIFSEEILIAPKSHFEPNSNFDSKLILNSQNYHKNKNWRKLQDANKLGLENTERTVVRQV